MRNLFLDPYSASDIDRFVAKVLADLGEPDPPVQLIDVRELLRLDKSYYSSTDDSAISEVVHKLTVAGQQVLARPSILKDVIGKLGLKALLLPDRRRILIDSETPDVKQRWSEAHEIGHDLIHTAATHVGCTSRHGAGQRRRLPTEGGATVESGLRESGYHGC